MRLSVSLHPKEFDLGTDFRYCKEPALHVPFSASSASYDVRGREVASGFATMRLNTRITVCKIRSRQRKSNHIFNRLVHESGKSIEQCSGGGWYADSRMEYIALEAEERKAISDELQYEAQELYLPIPSLNDEQKWESSRGIGLVQLESRKLVVR